MRRVGMAADEESSPPPECFICTESVPAPRRSACKCTDRHVHDACLVRMLETGTHDRCPVCLAPYANLSCRYEVVTWTACSRGGAVCLYTIFALVLFVCATNTWWVIVNPYRHQSQRIKVVVFVAFVGIGIFGLCAAAIVAYECMTVGVANLVRSMLVCRRRVRITDVSSEVVLPPRLEASEFELAERHTRLGVLAVTET